MKIFLAGATGAAGQALIPLLTSHGHTVTGTTRSPSKTGLLRGLGAEPVVVDGLDRDGIRAAVATTPSRRDHPRDDRARRRPRPAAASSARSPPRTACGTEGTDHLLEAAAETGVERFIAQSYGAWPVHPGGRPGQDRGRPARPRSPQAGAHHARRDPPPRVGGHRRRRHRPALRRLLRPGHLARARRRAVGADPEAQVPIVGDGGGVLSFAHIDDVASGTLAALERGTPGRIYNITDDDPAPVRVWLPAIAKAIGAPPPRHIPRWVGRMLGEHLVVMMTEIRGASNERAKRELDWTPRWPSWRDGVAASRDARGGTR
jgi:nucleoside-diphosphate-sugar epimerase